MTTSTATLITRGALARRWSKTTRTLARYEAIRPHGYPIPFRIGDRVHYLIADVEQYESALIAAALTGAA